MQKRYLVILFVVMVIAVGVYFFQENRQKREAVRHVTKQLSRITQMTKKSPNAGLLKMGAAINAFHRKTGRYPDALSSLYPDYIPYRPFITEIEWEYTHQKNDFLLQKVVSEGRTASYVAAIGSDLKLEIRSDVFSSDQKVASLDPPVSGQQEMKTDTKGTKKRAGIKGDETEKVSRKEGQVVESGLAMDARVASLPPPQSIRFQGGSVSQAEESRSAARRKTEKDREILAGTVSKKKLGAHEQFLLSFDDSFYIWKSSSGIIGFSNIQYPEEKHLAYFIDKNWIVYSD